MGPLAPAGSWRIRQCRAAASVAHYLAEAVAPAMGQSPQLVESVQILDQRLREAVGAPLEAAGWGDFAAAHFADAWRDAAVLKWFDFRAWFEKMAGG